MSEETGRARRNAEPSSPAQIEGKDRLDLLMAELRDEAERTGFTRDELESMIERIRAERE